MRRGTTPYITIKTKQSLTGYSTVVFTIEDSSGTEISIDNKSGMMQVGSNQVTVKLTQDQTLRLKGNHVKMQLRAADSTGENAVASNVMTGRLDDVLKEGVIRG